MILTRRLQHLLATVLAALPLSAASSSIGIATAVTSYSINDSLVHGASSIPDGAMLATTTAPSDVRLQSGIELRLATRSAGTVYGDHVLLDHGAVRVSNFTAYPVATKSLQIIGDTPQSEAIVKLDGKTVEVASLGGSVRVTDGGAMMTRVAAGTRMSFQDQAQAPTQTGASRPSGGLSDADRKALLWSIVAIAGAAVVIGSIAAAQGKNPF